MGTTTPNYNLFKPNGQDRVDVTADLAANFDKLDAHAHSGTYDATVIDVAAQYGTTAAAINLAITAANTAAVAIGTKRTVYLDARTWDLSTAIVPMNLVRVRGAGIGRTILRPTGTNAAVQFIGSAGNYLTDFDLEDLTIDGVNQSGTYAYTIKGIYVMYAARCGFRRLEIKNTYATGLGLDYSKDRTTVEDCTFQSCGRGWTPGAGGGNGLGMLAGATDVETTVVTNCWARSCGNYGFLVEKPVAQTGKAMGHVFTACVATSCTVGFTDAGTTGTVFDGCTAYANGIGFAVDSGDDGTYPPGQKGRIVNCFSYLNTGNGIKYDCSTIAAAGEGYTIAGNTVVSNGTNGIVVLVGSVGDATKISIRNNEVYKNGTLSTHRGINLQTTGTSKIRDLTLVGNTVGDNTAIGIEIDADIPGALISGNRCYTVSGGVQTTGLKVDTGRTLTNVVFSENDFSQQTTPISHAGTVSGGLVSTNQGWNDPFVKQLQATGAIASTYPRQIGGSSQALLTTQLQAFVAIYLKAGDVVTNITFVSGGTAAGTPTNQWFSLYSAARAKLGVTADDTTTAWAASTPKTLAMASPYTVPTSGLYYLGIMVKATTVPSIVGQAVNGGLSVSLAPVLAGVDGTNTGLTNPASAPVTAAAFTASSIAYAHVS